MVLKLNKNCHPTLGLNQARRTSAKSASVGCLELITVEEEYDEKEGGAELCTSEVGTF